METHLVHYFLDKHLEIKDFNSQNYHLEYYMPLEMVRAILAYHPFPSEKKFSGVLKTLEFLDYLFEKGFKNGKYTPIPIHINIWRQFFSSKLTLSFKKMLLELDLIEVTRNELSEKLYLPGLTSINYRIKEHWLTSNRQIIYVDVGRNKVDFIRKELKYFEISELHEEKVEVKAFFDLEQVAINEEAALKAETDYYAEGNTTKKMYMHRLASIKKFNLKSNKIFRGQKGHRLYHKVSNLSRITRKHLYNKQNGKPYMSWDVKNCQPLLLVAVLRSKKHEVDENYLQLCEQGRFYETFIDLYKTRKEVKDACYKNIFFDQSPSSTIFKRFKELFPSTHASLLALCDDPDFSLAAELQKMESSIFNSIKGRDGLLDRHFTLHDAIYFWNDYDLLWYEYYIKVGFEKHGIKPILELT